MKTMIVYDTETTGLPIWERPSEDPAQPHITQLAAQLCDEETGQIILGSINFMIKPDGWTIPADLAALTGITTEKAEAYGVPLALALDAFERMWRMADVRVAHNESFDARMLRISFFRTHPDGHAIHDEWKGGASFCTADRSTAICDLPPTAKMQAAGRRGPKKPNLGEAYKHFTGKTLVGAHNASVDIMACKAVYLGIRALSATTTNPSSPAPEPASSGWAAALEGVS